MKITEFMLGDWVLYNGTPTKMTPALMYFDIGDYQPIPITAKILDKNGLSKLVTYGTEKWVCDKFRLNEYDNKGVWRFCAYTNRNEDSVIYIRYVHELQHALKLCGIEKEITL